MEILNFVVGNLRHETIRISYGRTTCKNLCKTLTANEYGTGYFAYYKDRSGKLLIPTQAIFGMELYMVKALGLEEILALQGLML